MDLMEVERQMTPVASICESSFSFDFPNGSCDSDIIWGNGVDGNIKFFKLPVKNAMVALMEHPSSFTVYQYVSIQALSGIVSVLGYEISPQSRPIEVFSSEKTGLIEIKTETYHRVWRKRGSHEELYQRLVNISESDDFTNKVLNNLGKTSVAVFVKRIPYPANLQFLEIYFPLALAFGLSKKKAYSPCRLHVNQRKHKPIQFSEVVEQLIAKISMFIRSSKLAEGNAPRVVICGPKNIGKSSLIRYIINKLLCEHSVAYYLDTDPGQAEFTPPGVVSLTKVSKPIIGPSFCHLKDPLAMVFIGSINPTSPDMYSKSVAKLMQLYHREFSDEPLFVNTMGWMEGFGLQCLGNVITIVKPNVLVEILNEDGTSMFDYRPYLPDNSHFIQIPCSSERKTPYFSAKSMREMALLSYFGKCQSPYLGPTPLNEIRPYSVSWDKIPLYTFHQKLQPFRMVEAVSHSIVALCFVPESTIMQSSIPQYPLTVEEEPDNECLGFGFVRAVDEENHLLYIITPLRSEDLKKVNAIIKGNIVIPDVVILNQDIYEVELPYTYYRSKHSVEKEKDECSMTMAGKEAAAVPETTPRSLTVSYHKTIPRRNNRSSFKQH